MMATGVLIVIPVLLGGLIALGVGGYALYEGFTKNEDERFWLGSLWTARIVGIVCILFGLLTLCGLPLAFFLFFGIAPTTW